MRPSKDRKHQKKRTIKRNKVMKTEETRQRRTDNGHIRTHFKSLEPDLKFKLIKGEIHTYTLVPSALPEGTIKTECDYELNNKELYSEDIEATIKFCNESAEDEHEGAEELAKMEDSIPKIKNLFKGLIKKVGIQ